MHDASVQPAPRRRTLRALVASAVSALVVGVSAPAFAQGLSLARFEPSHAGDRFFGVDSPYVAGHLALHAMILGDYAHDPLVLRTSDGMTVTKVVEHQLIGHANVGFALWDRVALNVDLPVALYQAGESGSTLASPETADLGDLRVGLRLRLFGDYFDPFQIGIGGYVWVPTGGTDGYMSDGELRGEPALLLGGRIDRLVWSAAAGPQFRPSQAIVGASSGKMLRWGVGLGVLLLDDKTLQIGPEASGTVVFDDIQKRTTNVEGMLGIKYRFLHDFEIGAAGGPGFTTGLGPPPVRAVARHFESLGVKPPVGDRDGDKILDDVDACIDTPGVASSDPAKHGCPPPKDTDGDGIIDDKDACPAVPGVATADPKTNGCPPPPPPKDTDGDGIIDDKDACPTVPGVATEDPKTNGCPPPKDTDGDGVVDPEDACVDIPGIKTADPATNGCPGDRDGDSFRDDKDACPDEKGEANADPKKNGCPAAVRVTETEIVILEQVQFDTGRSTIKPVSDPLLNQVAQVLADHAEILKIEVQGHTDNKGSPAMNKKLSQSRADAVKKALVKRKIDEGRLTAKGYGQDVPIGDNKTDEGRQQNRRVQFKITEKAAKK